jgi:hypothetical protein
MKIGETTESVKQAVHVNKTKQKTTKTNRQKP